MSQSVSLFVSYFASQSVSLLVT